MSDLGFYSPLGFKSPNSSVFLEGACDRCPLAVAVISVHSERVGPYGHRALCLIARHAPRPCRGGGAPPRAEEGRGLRPPAEARLSAWCSVVNVVPEWTLCPVFLCQCPIQSLQDVVKGLFVCCVFLDYVSLSQRFIPELINFLVGILYIAAPNRQSQGELIGGSVCKYTVL